jgi:hypothetical protein
MTEREKWHEIFKADCDEGLKEVITKDDLPTNKIKDAVITFGDVVQKVSNSFLPEYMEKKNLTLEDMKEHCVVALYPYGLNGDESLRFQFKYNDEVIVIVRKEIDTSIPLGEFKITKGDW